MESLPTSPLAECAQCTFPLDLLCTVRNTSKTIQSLTLRVIERSRARGLTSEKTAGNAVRISMMRMAKFARLMDLENGVQKKLEC